LEIFLESPDIIFNRIYYSWNAITQDPDDNKFFDVAVAASIPFPKVNIISADAFLAILQKMETS
jgi:uncharacterized protein